MQYGFRLFNHLGKFQSAPLVAEGRCAAPSRRGEPPAGFNPRPSLPRGDAPGRLAPPGQLVTFQSAPLVAEGRCQTFCRSHRLPCCFNPRPSLPRGDAATAPSPRILYRCFNPRPSLPRGDAPRPVRGFFLGVTVSIRAPRCRGAMLLTPYSSPESSTFQSAPLVAEGRCPGQLRAAARGAAGVSIRAPRCRGAMPGRLEARHLLHVVSIRAPRCRGAMLA